MLGQIEGKRRSRVCDDCRMKGVCKMEDIVYDIFNTNTIPEDLSIDCKRHTPKVGRPQYD